MPTAVINEALSNDMMEIEAADAAAVINPLNRTAARYVGYMPIKLGNGPELFWALADTGA